MTPAQIKKAEQLLAKKQQMLNLVDRHGDSRGKIGVTFGDKYDTQPCLRLESGGAFSLDTLEKWIKQAKKAHKMRIV